VHCNRELLVIIPAYNEEANVAQVYHNIEAAPAEADVLVVDRGSCDGRPRRAAGAGPRSSR